MIGYIVLMVVILLIALAIRKAYKNGSICVDNTPETPALKTVLPKEVPAKPAPQATVSAPKKVLKKKKVARKSTTRKTK